MRHVDRSAVGAPQYLVSDQAHFFRQTLFDLLTDTRRAEQTRVDKERLDLNEPTVALALEELFHGKCAFCEQRGRLQPYRFRPPGQALPQLSKETGHLYYAWLAEAWENIYPICLECLPEEPEYFPVVGKRAPLPTPRQLSDYLEAGGHWPAGPPAEAPLLLDPCRVTAFGSHLHVQLDGELIGLSPAGQVTAEHFRLNRTPLARQRASAFAEYRHRLYEAVSPSGPYESNQIPFAFEDLAFGGAWHLVLRRVALELAEEGARPILSTARIGAFFMSLNRRKDARRRLDAAFAAIEAEDRVGPPKPVDKRPAPRTATARLTRVEIINFKGVEHLSFQVGAETHDPSKRKPALLIIGENAAGKSTILEGVALALSDHRAREGLKLDWKGLRLDPARMGDLSTPKREHGSIRLEFDDAQSRQLDLNAQGVRTTGRTELPPVFAYGAFRQYRDGRRNYTPHQSIITLFRSDHVLSNPEDWLQSLADNDFTAVARALRGIVGAEEKFEVLERRDGRCVLVQRMGEAGDRPVTFDTPLSMVSSGYRAVLAMACDLLRGLMDRRINPKFESFESARGVVLIDEIEAHLHPKWKVHIMAGLRAALPNLTFIATTHDPLCLRGMEDGEVLVMHRVPRNAATRKTRLPVYIEQLTGLPHVSRLTLEQLLTSDFFSLLSTDSPQAERDLARIADLLTRRDGKGLAPLTEAETRELKAFQDEIATALPIGSSRVQQIVQRAVGDYLAKRRDASAERLVKLEGDARRRILEALEGL